MVDLSEFEEEDFDPRLWINIACNQRVNDEPLDKFLAELEMKLQLTAEEVETSLQESSMLAMRRIPYAIQETFRLQGDVQGMQDQVSVLLLQVHKDGAEASQSVSDIAQLDLVKFNMESACSTLKEATELSGLFLKVEEVFAAGDLPSAAELVISIRKSLSLVGEVPEFKGGVQKLKSLEDRLRARVEGGLADAFSRKDDSSVKKLCEVLIAVDRYQTIESLYCTSRLAKVHQVWESFQGLGDIIGWLPRFYEQILRVVEEEYAWARKVLPGRHAALVATLTRAIFTKTCRTTKEKLAVNCTLGALLSLQRDALAFTKSIEAVLKEAEEADVEHITKLVFDPLEEQVAKYGELEKAQLDGELKAVITFDSSTEDLDSAIKSLVGSIPMAFGSLLTSVDRCLNLTGGTEIKSLLCVVDDCLAQFIALVQGIVDVLQQRYGKANSESPSVAEMPTPSTTDHADITSMLHLVKLSSEVSSHLSQLEAVMRTTISAIVPKLELSTQHGTQRNFDVVTLRLCAFPDKLSRLQQLLTSTKDPRFIALPKATAQSEGLSKHLQDVVFATLVAPVVPHFRSFAGMPEWTQEKDAIQAAVLPSFNAYPLPYITTVGEYLMNLPQQLEVLLLDDSDGANAEELAGEWLDRVVTGVAMQYSEIVLKLPGLSSHGAVQLAADVDYFCNVMTALHVAAPPHLAAIQVLLGLPTEQLNQSARAAVLDGSIDQKVAKSIFSMRGVELNIADQS